MLTVVSLPKPASLKAHTRFPWAFILGLRKVKCGFTASAEVMKAEDSARPNTAAAITYSILVFDCVMCHQCGVKRCLHMHILIVTS